MPVDVNQICVEGIEKANASTAGRFFIAGGGPPVGQAGEAANAIKVSITMKKQCIINFVLQTSKITETDKKQVSDDIKKDIVKITNSNTLLLIKR